MLELWDLLDVNRNHTGQTHVRGLPIPNGKYHLCVHIFIVNSKGQILMSKRHPDKPLGNLWECTGGSVVSGEDSLMGAIREVKEELGIELNPEEGKLIYQETFQVTHNDIWLFYADVEIGDLVFQEEEVVDAKWVTKEEYEEMMEAKELVPKMYDYFNFIFKEIEK